MTRIVIATRGSALALRQVELVIESMKLASPDVEVEVRTIRTEGDRDQTTPLEQIGGQGVFVKDIERQLLAGEAHVAVHSLKDMPAQQPEGLTIAAYLPREDPRDVLVSRSRAPLAELPPGARIGTDSKRRAVQLQEVRPDIEVVSIRGNVDSRLRKVESGDYDAVVLASAGLRRLGLRDSATQTFSIDEMLPAAGQGIIAVQCRADDEQTLALLTAIDHESTHIAADAERSFLKRLGAGCRLPVGAYAVVTEGRVHLRGFVADERGSIHRADAVTPVAGAAQLGVWLAERLSVTATGTIPHNL